MKRTLFSFAAVMAVVAYAVSASAAVSISLSAASNTVLPGGVITLTTLGTSNAGETDDTIFGAINYSNTFLTGNAVTNTQAAIFNTPGALTCTTAFCVAFSQVNSTGPIAIGATNLLVATTTFNVSAGAPAGTVLSFTWRTTPSTQRLDWFGLTNAAGTTVTVAAIPEPGTMAMVGLGLMGLAFAGRRRAQ
jgi:PEP-CTERM motif-containing protein